MLPLNLGILINTIKQHNKRTIANMPSCKYASMTDKPLYAIHELPVTQAIVKPSSVPVYIWLQYNSFLRSHEKDACTCSFEVLRSLVLSVPS